MDGRFVLFDFDGVIADSFALAYDVARIVHHEANLTPDDYRALFEGNVYETASKLQGGMRRERFHEVMAPRVKGEVTLVPGMDAVVRDLASAYTLVIISSTASPHISDFLERHTLAQHFADVLGSDVHTSKVEKIRMVFEKFGTSREQSVFITDTLGDMREAKAHEVGAIGVSWGWHSHDRLEKGIPFRIVDRPQELPDTVDDFFTRGSDP